MKPASFEYHTPATLAEALTLIAELDDVRPIAGGQSLMPMMNYRFVQPEHVVDLNGIDELFSIQEKRKHVSFGAMTRQADILSSPMVAQKVPVMHEAMAYTGHVQTRNRGTIGGSLCHLDPTAELAALTCLHDDTAMIVASAARGERSLSFAEFAQGYMETGLEEDELLIRVDIPIWPKGHGYAFTEFAQRHGDFAIVAVGVLLESKMFGGGIKRAAITVSGLTTTPLRCPEVESFLAGKKPDKQTLDEAVTHLKIDDVLSDAYVSDNYRRHLANVLLKRTLHQAAERMS